MKTKKQKLVDSRKKEIVDYAQQAEWELLNYDSNSGCLRFQDYHEIYTFDIWLSKLTISIIKVGHEPIYKKKVKMDMIKFYLDQPEEL